MSRPSIVWITIDSVRADHTSLCGYQRETTPNLQTFANEDGSQSFRHGFAHAIWSLPSVASILTGRYPSNHGVGLWNDVLPDSIPTVPEMLSENGWRTAGVSVNSFFSPTTGLDRGFDSFTKVERSDLLSPTGVQGLAKYLTVDRTYNSGGLTRDQRKHHVDYFVQEIVKERLDELAADGSEFFLKAHYQGAHHPYYPSLHFARDFEDEYEASAAEAREFAFAHTTDVYREIARGCPYSEAGWDALVGTYDALVRQSDALVGDLLDYIDSNLDDVIVVVTSDHGDLLGEYGLLSHKLVTHDAVSRVPLVVKGIDGLSNVEGGFIQHADVMQTLLAELGLPHESLHGEDLSTTEREFVVTQRGEQTCQKTLEEVREYEPDYQNEHVHEPLLTALRGTSFKYLESGEATRLYELPDETRDVSETYTDLRDEMQDRLSAWFEEFGNPVEADEDAEFSDATRERLRQLGYVVD